MGEKVIATLGTQIRQMGWKDTEYGEKWGWEGQEGIKGEGRWQDLGRGVGEGVVEGEGLGRNQDIKGNEEWKEGVKGMDPGKQAGGGRGWILAEFQWELGGFFSENSMAILPQD